MTNIMNQPVFPNLRLHSMCRGRKSRLFACVCSLHLFDAFFSLADHIMRSWLWQMQWGNDQGNVSDNEVMTKVIPGNVSDNEVMTNIMNQPVFPNLRLHSMRRGRKSRLFACVCSLHLFDAFFPLADQIMRLWLWQMQWGNDQGNVSDNEVMTKVMYQIMR